MASGINPAVLVVGGAGLLLLLFVIATYNSLVSLRNHISEAWSNIETELKRRYELIPNLVETVKGYAAHERGVLDRVVELRSKCLANHGRPEDQAVDENLLVAALGNMIGLAENYPNLKADRNYLELQKELVNTEDRIQAARRFFNGNVRDYRNRCDTFPSSIIARFFGFEAREYFRVKPSVREVPDVDFG